MRKILFLLLLPFSVFAQMYVPNATILATQAKIKNDYSYLHTYTGGKLYFVAKTFYYEIPLGTISTRTINLVGGTGVTVTGGVQDLTANREWGFSIGQSVATTATPTFAEMTLSGATASTIASFDASKNIKSLSTATYPNLTELSYLKGVTGAIQTALDLKLATATAASTYAPIESPNFTGNIEIQGTTATDSAPLGAELLTSSNWTSTSWTGDFATGFTHTTGNTSILSNTFAATNASFYQITYTVTGRTVGSFDITFGGVTTSTVSTTGAVGIKATSTGALSILPTSTFDGKIVISIKVVGVSEAFMTFKNSSGTIVNQIRNGFNNTSIFYGVNSGSKNTTGIYNTSFGSNSFVSNTTGSNNAAFGLNALTNNTDGYQNTANGFNSLSLNTTGINNTANGSYSLRSNTTGNRNVANGGYGLFSNQTGNNNTASGYFSLYTNQTGDYNTGIGYYSLYSNQTGNYNNAVGTSALQSNTTGNYNTGIGWNSLYYSITGSQNIALGTDAGKFVLTGGATANTTPNNSIFIGYNTKALADNQTNQIVIGHNSVGNGSNTTVIGNTATTQTQLFGNTVISNASQPVDAGYKLDVAGTARATQYNLSALNTAPASSSATGTLGEIRWANGYMYLCVATNTWQRAALTTW